MVHKIISLYDSSDVFLFTLPQNRYNGASSYHNDDLRNSYNLSIKYIANYFDLPVVDLDTMPNWQPLVFANDGLHPNNLGMIKIADKVIEALNSFYIWHSLFI